MSDNKKISMAVINRLPIYYRYLHELLKSDIIRISSKELSEKIGITASQIRQDLNCFGGFGQQGYGYNVEHLYNEIGKILGVDALFKTIIVGAGNMGQALANYTNFEKRGFELIGIFDVSPVLIGTKIRDIEVESFENITNFIKNNKVDIGMICVPSKHAIPVAEKLVDLGVRGLWNFSPVDLKFSEDVVIENVHLSDSLMILGYKLTKNN